MVIVAAKGRLIGIFTERDVFDARRGPSSGLPPAPPLMFRLTCYISTNILYNKWQIYNA